MDPVAPERTRVYRNHHLDSTRWDRFLPRDDDIFVTTAYKAGTTWTQRILAALVLGPGPLEVHLRDLSPWIDARFLGPIEPMLERVEAQRHRRFLKSHLAADGLRFFPQAKYLVVGRDTRDVFMSLFNHYSGVHRIHVHAVQRRRSARARVPALPGDAARAVAALDRRGLVRLGARRLAVLVAPPPPRDVVGGAICPTCCSSTTATSRPTPKPRCAASPRSATSTSTKTRGPRCVATVGLDAMRERSAGGRRPMSMVFEGGAAQFFSRAPTAAGATCSPTTTSRCYERAAATLDPALRQWLEAGRHAVEP